MAAGKDPFLLPFPVQPPEAGRLAPRRPSLSGQSVVLFDNSRMSYPSFAEIGGVMRQSLQAHGATVVAMQYPLLSLTAEQLQDCAEAVVRSGVSAAVIGLAEAGITQGSVALAVLLEARGIATATICTDPGVQLAKSVAAAVLPGLAMIDLAITPEHTPRQAGEQARAMLEHVIAALTSVPVPLPAVAPLFPDAGALRSAWQAAAKQPDAGVAMRDFLRACEQARIGDGLPCIPPSALLVDAMAASVRDAREAVLVAPTHPSGAAITVELAAINAVMAGCEPAHFPVVLAALHAMAAPRYRLAQSVITTHPGTNLILVSGPLAQRAGVSSGGGCLGPGQRANLSIGRAVNLCMMNVLRSIPGLTDLGTLGSVAEIGTCFADAAYGNWTSINEELAGPRTSTVTVHRCAAPYGIMDLLSRSPEGVLDGIAAAATSIACNNAYYPAELIVVLAPDHARILQAGGWSRRDVRNYLFEHARNRRDALRGRGIDPAWPKWFAALEDIPIAERPEDILVTVAGGPGGQSLVAVPWGLSRASTTVIAEG